MGLVGTAGAAGESARTLAAYDPPRRCGDHQDGCGSRPWGVNDIAFGRGREERDPGSPSGNVAPGAARVSSA